LTWSETNQLKDVLADASAAAGHRRGDGRSIDRVSLVLGFAHRTGVRLAEVGFLLLIIAGIWLAAAQIPQLKFGTARTIVAAVAIATGGLLLLIATHWGHFG
jgi:hypothetical protein